MRAATALVMLLFVGGAGAQDAADWDIDGITYYFAAGSHTSSHMTFGLDNSGANQTEFVGCVHTIMRDRPETNDAGRVSVIGRLGGRFMEVDFSQFEGTLPDMDGGIAQDVWVDGSHLHVGEIQHPAVLAGMAAWGTSTLYMDTLPYPDPVTGRSEYQTSMFVTPQGFRDDDTGAIHNIEGGIWEPGQPARRGADDWETHLRVESLGDRKQPDDVQVQTRPGDELGYFTPSEGYLEHFLFPNLRFGGTALVQIESEALAQPGENAIAFTVRDPDGIVVDQHVLQPALLSPDGHSVEIPLDKFGVYSVTASGVVALSSYTLTYTMRTPATFDMDFWWDNTTFARESTQTLYDCQDAVGSPEELTASVVERVAPPQFEWVPIGVGMGAGVLGIIIAGKLIHMSATGGRRF